MNKPLISYIRDKEKTDYKDVSAVISRLAIYPRGEGFKRLSDLLLYLESEETIEGAETTSEEHYRKMLGQATDLKEDLTYAFENNEGQIPNQKDTETMEWLIAQAKKMREWERHIEEVEWVRQNG